MSKKKETPRSVAEAEIQKSEREGSPKCEKVRNYRRPTLRKKLLSGQAMADDMTMVSDLQA